MRKEDALNAVEDVSSFLAGGGSVCSFATMAARCGQVLYCPTTIDAGTQRTIAPVIRRFLQGAQRDTAGRAYACIVIDTAAPTTAAEHRDRAYALREEVGVAILQSQRLLPIAWGLRSQAKHLLEERPGVLSIPAGALETVLFAMAPHYPPRHRRHAPRLILPLTLRNDAIMLGTAHPKVVEMIHDEVFQRCDELLGAMAFYEEMTSESSGA